MSRRHHGRSRQGRPRGAVAPGTPARTEERPPASEPAERPADRPAGQLPSNGARLVEPVRQVERPPAMPLAVESSNAGPAGPPGQPADNGLNGRAGCTAPQLRRFIKSRPYVPMHELRRRFGINGAEDDVTALPLDESCVYVGLPERECQLLGELVRGGEVGYELSLDPRTPIVVGVYPMRPVPRA